jgi:hypothetical protein
VVDWRKVPWPLWAYAVLTLGSIPVVFVTTSVPVVFAIFTTVLLLCWTLFLLRGVRWLWLATLAIDGVSLIVDLATGAGTWHGHLISVVSLVLLLLPATREFFSSRERSPSSTQAAMSRSSV